MIRGIPLLFVLMGLACAQTLEEAAQGMVKKIASRLAPGEPWKLTGRNLSSLSAVDAGRARMLVERGLRKGNGRNPNVVEIVLTVSENVSGYLLVAEMRRGDERMVEMTAFRGPGPVTARARAVVSKKLLWEQDGPVLDVAAADGHLVVLEPSRLAVYARGGGDWTMAGSQALETATVRDPRGRLVLQGDRVVAHLPGTACSGTWRPGVELRCEAGGGTFAMGELAVRFSERRNTLEAAGWPPLFSYARAGWHVVGETDGKVRLYDSERQAVGTVEGWGSDVVGVNGACGGGAAVLAASAAGREGKDTVALYEVVDRKATAISEALELPGPVTALWGEGGEVTAIVRVLATERYAAYGLAVDCSR